MIKANKMGFLFIYFLFFIIIQSCLSYRPIVKKETIPVDWSDNSSERISSQIIKIMNQNIRRYRYYIYTHSINENSQNSSWNNEIEIVTYNDGESIYMTFNYFAIDLHYTNDYDLKIKGIPARVSTMRGSANEFNSTLERVAFLLEQRKFNDTLKFVVDLFWLDAFRLKTVSSED